MPGAAPWIINYGCIFREDLEEAKEKEKEVEKDEEKEDKEEDDYEVKEDEDEDGEEEGEQETINNAPYHVRSTNRKSLKGNFNI